MAENLNEFDLVIIGSGPAGEVGAIRAAQLGMRVALIEKNEHLGGTCLNVGCIPTKALLQSASTLDKLKHAAEFGFSIGDIEVHWSKVMERKDKIVDQQRKGLRFLMKKNKVTVFEGHGRIASRNSVTVTAKDGAVLTLQTKNTLIATGSRVREFDFARSNGKTILNSDSVLSIDHIPTSMAIIGGGVVGTEFASLFSRFGCAVTIIELAPKLCGMEDDECVQELSRIYKKIGVTIETSTKLTKLEDNGDSVTVHVEGKEPRKFARVLVAIGREPVTADVGLKTVGIETEKGGQIKTDMNYRTKVPNIFAVGDVLTTPALAHTASAEAIHAVEVIAGHHPPLINYDANPNAIYAYPEIASIGKTESALKAAKVDYAVAKFPFAPLAKAKIEGMTDGFVKILYGKKYRELLGVHIVHAKATEFIAEFSLGKILETTVDEIAHTIHPHPTLSETIMEAAHVAMGGAIHL